jgi:hypothetical protein
VFVEGRRDRQRRLLDHFQRNVVDIEETSLGRIDLADFAKFASYWLESCSEPQWCGACDLHQSKKVDFADLEELSENWLWQAGWHGE